MQPQIPPKGAGWSPWLSFHFHDDVIKWKHFPRYWLFVRGFTGPGESPSQRPVTRNFKFSLICAWRNVWENNREAGDLRRNQTHCDVGVMSVFQQSHYQLFLCNFTKYSDQIKQRNALINLCNIPARCHLLCTLLSYRIKYVFRIVSSIASYITCIGPRQ